MSNCPSCPGPRSGSRPSMALPSNLASPPRIRNPPSGQVRLPEVRLVTRVIKQYPVCDAFFPVALAGRQYRLPRRSGRVPRLCWLLLARREMRTSLPGTDVEHGLPRDVGGVLSPGNCTPIPLVTTPLPRSMVWNQTMESLCAWSSEGLATVCDDNQGRNWAQAMATIAIPIVPALRPRNV